MDGKDECVSLPGFDHHLCMAWRQDNAGPQSAEEVCTLAVVPGIRRHSMVECHVVIGVTHTWVSA